MASNSRTAEATRQEDIDAIREDLASLKTDLSSLVTDIAAGGKHFAQRGAETLTESARSAATQLKTAQESACNTVRSHPMASVFIAAGVGAIAARLLMHRGRR